MVRKYGAEKLWTLLPIDGVWHGSIPRQPGDFAYSNKLPWGGSFRDKDGPLTVMGKRLDGPAPYFHGDRGDRRIPQRRRPRSNHGWH